MKIDQKGLTAVPGEQAPLKLSVTPKTGETVTKIMLEDVPQGTKVTPGSMVSTTSWELDPTTLSQVRVTPPKALVGKFDVKIVVDFTDSGGQARQDTAILHLTVTPDSQRRKAGLAIVIAFATALVTWIWFDTLQTAESKLNFEKCISWVNEDPSVYIVSGPASFKYDPTAKCKDDNRDEDKDQDKDKGIVASGAIMHVGPITKARKQELLELVKRKAAEAGDQDDDASDKKRGVDGKNREPDEVAFQSYYRALDKLAYGAKQSQGNYLPYLLLLGGLGGVMGVLIRTLLQFVQITAVETRLNVARWWPWYVIRPLLGFMFGVLAVLVIEAQLFVPGETAPSGTVWWLAISVLVGFGAEEFGGRLRLISKALFGKV